MPAEQLLRAYAELVVRVGLNLQPGQRLAVTGARGGVALECAPFVRHVVEAAYDAGASDVVVRFEDQQVRRAGMARMAPAALVAHPRWIADAGNEHALAGDASLVIDGSDPGLLRGIEAARLSAWTEEWDRRCAPRIDAMTRMSINWNVVTAPTAAWASRVFPELDPADALERLWGAVLHAVRADLPDPVEAWSTHLADLAARAAHLNRRAYRSLRAVGPGTDVEIGLADRHVWGGGVCRSALGIPFVPNLPTEEIFTAPHRERVNGHLAGTQPVLVRGTLVEGWRLEFREGRVVAASAVSGEAALRQLLATDDGAARLGEVALVPEASPTRATGVRFESTIFEENISCHVALGQVYASTIEGGGSMSADELASHGGNASSTHDDIMWGSSNVAVSGVRADGKLEPLLVGGEWGW